MRLSGLVVWVLPENYHLDGAIWRELQGSEYVIHVGVDGVLGVLHPQKLPELQIIFFRELPADYLIPVVTDDDHIR